MSPFAPARQPPGCPNHPEQPAAACCRACGRWFCPECLVELLGQPLCEPCKKRRLEQLQAGGAYLPEPVSTVPPENWWAVVSFALALCGLYPCVGLATGPLAVIAGILGLIRSRQMAGHPRKWAAVTGLALGGVITIGVWGWMILSAAHLLR